jgi:hypothetical protein
MNLRRDVVVLGKPKKMKQTKLSMTYLATLRPRKNRAMSWSDDCHGNPRARTTQLLSTISFFELKQNGQQFSTLRREEANAETLRIDASVEFLICITHSREQDSPDARLQTNIDVFGFREFVS